ncbi:protein of unknown function [Ruminococcaceae bacterium YRB3002]|jgi:uncharacterized beta-barrel protein YwiB (DUF1934 family)|nr:protein of unknown function [Ruminococcaceae bacterium YRB3002]
MKVDIEITTNVYPEPFVTVAIMEEKDGIISYKWCEKRTPEEKESLYELILDLKRSRATVKRSGNIRSEMEFAAGEETLGAIDTFYGLIPVKIHTEYLNMPSVMSGVFEMKYTLSSGAGGEDELIKNVFSLKRLLQNQNC